MADLQTDLAKSAQRVLKHMNEDHEDSLLVYAHFFARLDTATSAKVTALSASGLELEVVLSSGHVMPGVNIPYSRPLKSAGDLRKVVEEMHSEAYNGMGMAYKLQTGYYPQSIKAAWTHMPNSAKNGAMAAAVAVALGAVAVVYTRRRRLS
mmetsp:Transcript_27009/g.89653  ORF Transcript_27009/g.89653 Transcript_27009/m.89653 type:complete len:151 (+) Transcript_27009:75-527(+)|eukprot:CAMPEP_0203863950 /NCGR_PEP_ID=MMETSP0359-20131031/14470_1 /ASSEMBLY_ACC=CAM_ASM_000338 /TAXON_ID=268821 /ORGANISM="Scrippsiella Hangoei, Strain SHTV-5" /LENGTH=150 /DNA_ID=CAMNT_0050781589 /DNA_START=65 /DNA_END=517 /DNA_ORIENTATION=-